MATPLNSSIGDLSTQWKWHETFRDTAKNMYRTSYNDMVHGREVACKSDFPSGYGGHIPTLRHDVLFRNTAFDRKIAMMRMNPSRDGMASYGDQIEGIPTYCTKPRGSKKVPTAGTIPNSTCKPPWALTLPLRDPPTFRTQPMSANRSLSTPGFRSKMGMTGGSTSQDMGQHLADANERAMNTSGLSERDMLLANSVAPGVEMQQASYRRTPSDPKLRMGMTM